MTLSIPLVLDGFLALMLIVTIACCIVLYRRLLLIRKSDSEMRSVISDFTVATERAQTGLLSLKTTGMDLTHAMQEKISEAKALNDDLRFMTDLGIKVADRLDRVLGDSQGGANLQSMPDKEFMFDNDSKINLDKTRRSETERELMVALQRSR